MGDRRRQLLRATVALFACLILTPGIGVMWWLLTAQGEVGYDFVTTSFCAYQQTETSFARNCIGLNAGAVAPLALGAGLFGLIYAWRPERRAARILTIVSTLAALGVIVWADVVTGRRDWAFAALALGLVIASLLLARDLRTEN